MDGKPAVVIDIGSSLSRAGFAGEKSPLCVLPTTVGYPNGRYQSIQHRMKDHYVCVNKDRCFKIAHPIVNGQITNRDEMEYIWHHILYYELHVDPANQPILLTESSNTPKENREYMIQVMFETFNVPSYCVANQALLSAYSTGRSTGLVFQSGEGVCEVVPVYEGCVIPHATISLPLTGSAITSWLSDNLVKLPCQEGNPPFDSEIVRDIKEKLGYVSLEYSIELERVIQELKWSRPECEASYTLPDSRTISLALERFHCPELLFQPDLNNLQCDSIDEAIRRSIAMSDSDFTQEFYANIILSGGNTMFKGLPERLKKQMAHIAPYRVNTVNVIAEPDRNHGTWIGGSVLASQAVFPQMVVSHEEYNEWGPGILHRKCL